MKLNKYYQPVDSIPAQPETKTTGFGFDSRFDRGVVSASQVKDQNITGEKLAADAIGAANIADNSVTTNKLDTGAVTTSKLAGSAVTEIKIAPLAVTNAKINDVDFSKGSGTISASTFKDGTITGGTINNSVLSSPSITGGTVSSPTIAGTAEYAVNAGTGALSANNQFEFQTMGGSAILVVRSGGTNFYFTAAGVL